MEKPDYQIIKPVGNLDKLMQVLEQRKARSRYQRDLESISRIETEDLTIKPAFYQGYNVQNNSSIIQELGQNPVPVMNVSNSYIPNNQQVQYNRSSGGGSSNFTPTTRREQESRRRLQNREIYLFKTAQPLMLADENWNEIASFAVKSGDRLTDQFELEGVYSYVIGFVNYSKDVNDYLIIVEAYDSDWNYLGVNGYSKSGLLWSVQLKFSPISKGGDFLVEDISFNSIPTYFQLRTINFANGSRTETIVTNYFPAPNNSIKSFESKDIDNTASSDYSSYARAYDYELSRQLGSYVYKGSQMNWLTEITETNVANYEESVSLPLDPNDSYYRVFVEGININANPNYVFIKSRTDLDSYAFSGIYRSFAIGGGVPGLSYSNTFQSTEIVNRNCQETISYPIWVDKTRQKTKTEKDIRINTESLIIREWQEEDYLIELEEIYYRFNTWNATGYFQWETPANDISVICVRRDGLASLYYEQNYYSMKDYLDNRYSLQLINDLYFPSNITLLNDYSQSALNGTKIVESQLNRFNLNYNATFSESLIDENNVVTEYDYTHINHIDNQIKYFIGDQELNIANSYVLIPETNISIPEVLPYTFSTEVNVYHLLINNTIKQTGHYKYKREIPYSGNFNITNRTEYHTFYPVESQLVSNLWSFIGNSDCYVLLKDPNGSKYFMYEGVLTTTYSITESPVYNRTYIISNTITEQTAEAFKQQSINTNTITSTITLTRLIHKFVGFSSLPNFIVFSKNNLLQFVKLFFSRAYFNWTEDNFMFIACMSDYDTTENPEKQAEIFPMQFDGANIIFREDMLMSRLSKVSIPRKPNADNYYYDDNFVLYNYTYTPEN